MKKLKVQEVVIARFEMMDIPLANRYKEIVVAFVHSNTKKWLCFFKAHLLNPNLNAPHYLEVAEYSSSNSKTLAKSYEK